MTSRIFIWCGHPRRDSLSTALADAYQRGAEASGAEIRRQDLVDMEFDADMKGYGPGLKMLLEPDLFDWQDNMKWASHIAWIYPLWWQGMPGRMKGAVDRALLPGFGFRYHDKGMGWDKLLAPRTADVIMTADTPTWWDRWVYHMPARRQVKNNVLGFCGVKVTDLKLFSPVKTATPETIQRWLKRAYFYGGEAGRR